MQHRLAFLLLLTPAAAAAESASDVRFLQGDGQLEIRIGEVRFADYVYDDPSIPRPYFANIVAPGGVQVTRNHPVDPEIDATDHAAMHPGVWLAFGDLGGEDFWRNQARVRHVRFADPPHDGVFTEWKQYLRPDGTPVCEERFHCAIRESHGGFLIDWDSTFYADAPFSFGDQEEMGLGVRVATPLAETNGGRLADSEGRTGADSIWGQAARWCDYGGVIDDAAVGVAILCDPGNFRSSWMHARDYGFVAANPFGRAAMHQGTKSEIRVEPGIPLQLRYGVWVHAGEENVRSRIDAVFDEFASAAPIVE